MTRRILGLLLGAGLTACCGGGQTAPPATAVDEAAEGEGDEATPGEGAVEGAAAAPEEAEEELIPPEKFDELQLAFRTKRGEAQRCYREGIDGGKVTDKDEGRVTLSLTVAADGRPRDVRVTESSLKNPFVEECLVARVAGWTLPAPGAEVPFSYAYEFEHD